MPLITQEMIDALRNPDGSHSRHALYLLGAIPKAAHRDDPLHQVGPGKGWEERVICSKLNGRQVMAIQAAARELHKLHKMNSHPAKAARRLKARESIARPFNSQGGVHPKYLRRLRRKLVTFQKRQLQIVDEIIDQALQEQKKAKAA